MAHHHDKTYMVAAAAASVVVTGATLLYYQQRRSLYGSSLHHFFKECPPAIPVRLLESPYAKELRLCVKLVHKAGQNMKGYLQSKGTANEEQFDWGDVMTKNANEADFCTQVDVDNEDLIIQGLEEAFPDYDIIGEESVGTGEIPRLNPRVPTFIIDPIDGTTNFSQGLFLTCVSIGFCVGGSPVMGVVYAPGTDEWYLAVSGYGAFRNGVAIGVTAPQHDQTRYYVDNTRERRKKKTLLSEAVVCCEFGYSRKQHEINAMLGGVSRILQHGCRAIRQLGSGVLDLCYVATGRLDIVYAGIINEGWKPWDYAAGLVICQEAGCIMEGINHTPGTDFDLYGKSVICGASRELVDNLRHVLLS